MTDATPAELEIRLGDAAGPEIAEDLWGIFLEDLNSALDGGLNADLVQNGDFEYTAADRPEWGPLTAWRSEGTVEVRTRDPLHVNNSTYVRLDAGEAPAVLVNGGYDPMPLAPGTHRIRLAVRRPTGAVRLEVTLRSVDGATLVSAPVPAPPEHGAWALVEVDLRVERHVGAAELVLTASEGAVDVDAVGLRRIDADTGHALTFRPDLLATLQQLRPAFVRFPGGCIAHGLGLDNLYHWKDTIGPRHERRQMPNLWGYHQSMAIGYLEYFELCRLLGATPLPVVAAGVCCQNLRGGPQGIPMTQMPQYVQDVLDLVEFANGDGSTTWGARRIELGHPDPFDLRYLGVGNEDQIDEQFEERFAMIHEALRERHPGVTVVGTSGPSLFGQDYERGWDLGQRHGVEMLDEHAYRSPHWWLQHTDWYDRYERSGPTVYMGEYAARSSTLRAALAEAAFMIGMERNGDVVRLASYAPLLAKEGRTQWLPDLIYFTPTEVRTTASYHVQQMISATGGGTVCEVVVQGEGQLERRGFPDVRTIRLRSPGAELTWTGIRLDSADVEDLRTGADGESATVGRWSGPGTELVATLTRADGTEGALITLGGEGDESFYEIHVGSWQNKSTVVVRSDDGIGNEIERPRPFRGVASGEPMTVRVQVTPEGEGARLLVEIDGEVVHDTLDDNLPERTVVVGASQTADGARVVRAVNASPAARRVRLATGLPGAVSVRRETLTGTGPGEGAPFEQWPHPPTTHESTGTTPTLDVELPAWSFSVLTPTVDPEHPAQGAFA